MVIVDFLLNSISSELIVNWIPIIICFLHSTTKTNLESTKKLIFATSSSGTSLKQTYYLKFLILNFDFN